MEKEYKKIILQKVHDIINQAFFLKRIIGKIDYDNLHSKEEKQQNYQDLEDIIKKLNIQLKEQ